MRKELYLALVELKGATFAEEALRQRENWFDVKFLLESWFKETDTFKKSLLMKSLEKLLEVNPSWE